jgi:hypothetical protein
MKLVPTLVFALLPTLALADSVPKLGRDEVVQLFRRAGFTVDGTIVRNRCGQKAEPRVKFTDINGDGRPEAVFIDAGPCYASGHWISILRQPAPGSWSLVLMAEGIGQPVAHRTEGWYDIALTASGAVEVLHFNGRRYVTAAGKAPGYAPPTSREAATPHPSPAPSAPNPAAAIDPSSQTTARSGEIKVAWSEHPTPAQRAAVTAALTEEAAGARSQGHELRFSVGEADLNGDGRPDLLVHLSESDWCGSAGCAAEAILATPVGYARRKTELGVNFVESMFVRPTMHGGMHDLRYDESSYVFRWNGQQYR